MGGVRGPIVMMATRMPRFKATSFGSLGLTRRTDSKSDRLVFRDSRSAAAVGNFGDICGAIITK